MNNLAGAVLCGGQSKRMGTDKGLILWDDQPWALHMFGKLQEINLPAFISVNASQQEAYLKYFKETDLVIDHIAIPGPLNGLMSIHDQHPDKDILLLACDMVNMKQETLETLVAAHHNHPGHDFYAYHNQQFWEPLCAIYTAKGLKEIKNQLLTDRDHSFQHVLNHGNSFKLDVIDARSFKNRNTRQDT